MISSTKYESLSKSEEYQQFRSNVPLRKVCVDPTKEKVWCIYDTGPRRVGCPLLCLAPAAGTADLFFLQLTRLAADGLRVVAMDYPSYSTVLEWCEGFRRVLDCLGLDSPHVMGVSLGGFLAQKFSEHTRQCPRVASLVLVQSHVDALHASAGPAASLHRVLPSAVLRGLASDLHDHGCSHHNPAPEHNFAVEQVHKLSPALLSSRLALVSDNCFVQPSNVQVPVTLVEAFSGCETRERAKNALLKCYPDAKLAYFKQRTTLPFLVEPDQFNLFLKVHLKEFRGTTQDPFVPDD